MVKKAFAHPAGTCSDSLREDKISIIGNGVVVDPWALLEEIEEIKLKGVDVNVNNFIKDKFKARGFVKSLRFLSLTILAD